MYAEIRHSSTLFQVAVCGSYRTLHNTKMFADITKGNQLWYFCIDGIFHNNVASI